MRLLLIVSTSFGEFIFSVGFTQKTAKEDINIKKISRDNFVAYTREGFRGHQRTLHRGRARELARWGRPAPTLCRPAPCGGKPPRGSGVFFHRLQGCISAIREVGLIQGLTFNLLGYK
jgi:hypothetical protein